jgi:hypothetical protein
MAVFWAFSRYCEAPAWLGAPRRCCIANTGLTFCALQHNFTTGAGKVPGVGLKAQVSTTPLSTTQPARPGKAHHEDD